VGKKKKRTSGGGKFESKGGPPAKNFWVFFFFFFNGPETYKWHVLDFLLRDFNGRFSAVLSNLMFY